MKVMNVAEMQNVNGGAWCGTYKIKCGSCKKTIYKKWYFGNKQLNKAASTGWDKLTAHCRWYGCKTWRAIETY